MSDVADRSTSKEAQGGTDSVRKPVRVRWLRRFGVTIGTFVGGMLLLRFFWGLAAHHRLEAEIERYRSAGQLVYAEEFNAQLDAVTHDRNAAVLLERALAEFSMPTRAGDAINSYWVKPTIFDTNMAAAHEVMREQRAVLELLHQARFLPEVAWSSRIGRTDPSPPLEGQQRDLAKLLGFAGAYHFRTGDHASAVATMRDFLAFNEAVDSHPSLISSFVAWSCHSLNFRLVEDYGAGLRIADDMSIPNDGSTPAQRNQVEDLIRDLLREQSMRLNVVRSCHGSRASRFHYLGTWTILDFWAIPLPLWSPISLPRSRSFGPRDLTPLREVVNFMCSPILVLDTTRAVQYATLAVQAAAEETWPQAARHFPPRPVNTHWLYNFTHPMTYTQFPPSERGVYFFFTALARRRMAAVALAIRLYEVDHGQRPMELASLVPAYLPELPQDPFALNEQTFGYDGLAARPLVYSVGRDGLDNHGKVVRTADGRRDREKSDMVFYLEPERSPEPASAPASASEAEDDKEEVEHAQQREAQN